MITGDDFETVADLLNLDQLDPKRVAWCKGSVGPDDWTFYAWLDLFDGDPEALLQRTDPATGSAPDDLTWLPDAVRAVWSTQAAHSFDGSAFTRGPLGSGRVLWIPGTTQVLLAFSTL